jgi:hypothetical protein
VFPCDPPSYTISLQTYEYAKREREQFEREMPTGPTKRDFTVDMMALRKYFTSSAHVDIVQFKLKEAIAAIRGRYEQVCTRQHFQSAKFS